MMLRAAWRLCGWCLRQAARLCLWSVWLVLLLAMAGQIHLLSSRRVPIPEPLRRAVEERLATHGLRLDYGRGRLDLDGHLMLENVRLSPLDAGAPFATAHSIYLHIDPWSLLGGGQPRLTEARIDGLDLDRVAERIDLAVQIDDQDIQIDYLRGYVGILPVQVSGRYHLPKFKPRPAHSATAGARITKAWDAVVRYARIADTWLAALDSPRLHLSLDDESVGVAVQARAVDLAALPGLGQTGMLTDVKVHTTVPLDLTPATPLTLTGSIKTLALPHNATAHDLVFALTAPVSLQAPVLDLQLSSIQWRDIASGPLAATVTQPARGEVQADLSLNIAGGDWRVQAAATPATGTAQVSLDGFIDDATLAFAGDLIKRELAGLLDPAQPAPVHVSAAFGPGWKLNEATGRLHSGSVRVGRVQLDETGTEFTYDGERVVCDALVLRQAESLAHGRYEMDTRTFDFRFLLTGGLRPMGIAGWFNDWWPHFWNSFDFSRSLPDADVDVRGRWGDITATNVFVQAEGRRTGLNGAGFDLVRTRLFLRPHWFDIRHFEVVQDDGYAARGWFARSMDLAANTWTTMAFDVDSTLPFATIAQIFPEQSAELLSPYAFTRPPRMHLTGRVDSPLSPAGKHEVMDIAVTSTGAMTYHGFRVHDLAMRALVRDDRIDLPALSFDFAGSRAQADVRLWGTPAERRLAFNINLPRADLGAVVEAVRQLEPSSPPPLSPKAAEAARLRQQRLEGGRLDFTLKAQGAQADLYGFKGEGRAAITNAELGQLNLFGPLSEALRGTFINFTSFSLNNVDAPFSLDGDRVAFNDLRITGPSALLLAKGGYRLRGGELDFTAKIMPFEETTSMFGSAASLVLSPFSKVFEVKLKGTLAEPSWIFSYGPTRLLKSLTASDAPAPVHTETP